MVLFPASALQFNFSMPQLSDRLQKDLTGMPRPPSLTEVLGMVLLSYVIFLIVLSLIGGSYWSLVGGKFGDNPDYLRAASAIRHWQFAGVEVKQFWGVSYAVASVSIVTGVSEAVGLVVVCVLASLASVALCYWLWDGWIAAFFALLSLDWFQRTLLGGAEPLFMALLLGSFLALRRDRWIYAATLASLATVVRPFGVFALVGLGIHLLARRRFRDCAIATAIGLVIGGLYVWPLKHYLGNPFANVAAYRSNDWRGGLPLNLPFVAIVHDTIGAHAPVTNLVLTFGWMLFILVGLAVAVRSAELQQLAKRQTAEACFVLLYCLALFTYDAPGWSRSQFPRFALAVLPWTLAFLKRYIPMDRKVVWPLAVIMPTLAAASAFGIRETWHVLLGHLR
jgi:hypothetical protein